MLLERGTQVTLDHKSAFHDVPLALESWEYYVGTVLCFGWCAPLYICHSLSDAVAQYLRSQHIPTSAWLDDFGCRNSGPHVTSARPAKEGSPRGGVALALTIIYRCDYSMASPKCLPQPTTDRVFLGVGCDTAQRRFYVTEEKLRKLEAILRDAIDSRSMSLSQLKKLAGKCMSISVAVPLASLHTRHLYRQIAVIERSEG